MSYSEAPSNLWHPFDIIGAEELSVNESLRTAATPAARECVYTERVTRWFGDKSDQKNQWPPTLDQKPGIRISCRPDGETMKVGVVQVWEQMINHELTASMECSASGWRSPSSWTVKHTFKQARSGREFVPDIDETGRWQQGTLTRTSQGQETAMTRSRSVGSLASVYALLANFPRVEEIPELSQTTLLQEGFVVTPDADLVNCPEVLREHPLAQGLRGYTLLNKGNFPSDFWVNDNGLVVYICLGPHRVFVLNSLQTIS
jgi:hypothetical protein